MKQSLLGITIILISAVPLAGQITPHIGLTSAVNTSFVLDEGLREDPRYRATYKLEWAPIGIAAGVDFNRGFGLQLEAILSNQGQVYDVIDIAAKVVGERRIDLQYVHLPLLFRFMNSSSAPARMNFSLGPQLSIMTKGSETLFYQASIQEIPPGVDIPSGAVENGDGTYLVPEFSETELLSLSAENEWQKFKNSEVQLAAGIGVDIDVASNIYLSTTLRANYSLTDMRNDDLINSLKQGSSIASDLFGQRANLLIGLQFGAHYMFGGVPSR